MSNPFLGCVCKTNGLDCLAPIRTMRIKCFSYEHNNDHELATFRSRILHSTDWATAIAFFAWFFVNAIPPTAGVGNLRPAKAFYPVRELLLSSDPRHFFSDKYAAINRRNDSHLVAKTFFLLFAIDSFKKSLKFWRRSFSFGQLERWRPAGTLLGPNAAPYSLKGCPLLTNCFGTVLHCIASL